MSGWRSLARVAARTTAAARAEALPALGARRPPAPTTPFALGASVAVPTRGVAPRALLPPSVRAFAAAAAAPPTPSRHACRDKIHMRGMTFHGYHGVLPEEKTLGQKFVVDVTMSACHLKAGASDDIEDTVDYARAFDIVRAEVEGRENARDLIECVGERIARALLDEFPTVADVSVRVEKPHVAVVGVLHSLGVEVYRERGTHARGTR